MDLTQISTEYLPKITETIHCDHAAPLRGWILLDPDVPHLRHVLSRCREFDINHLQISHGIVHTASDVLTERWRAERVNLISALAHEQGIETFLWTHELDRIPQQFMIDSRVDMRGPHLWEYLEQRYRNIFAAAEFDGLVLTFQETQASVYHDHSVASDEPQPARVTRLINFMHDLCRRSGKKLFARTFCYNQQEMNWILDGVEKAHPDVTIMTKCQPADWNPYYPHNRLIEHFSRTGRGFIVELDLGEEYHGQNALPYLCPQYIRYRLNHIINRQATLPDGAVWGTATRIERFGGRTLGSLNELNLHVFSAILSRPECNEHGALAKQLQIRFGDWGTQVGKLLAPTFDLINAVVYPVPGTWGYLMHSAVADLFYVHDSLAAWPHIDEWVDTVRLQGLAKRILNGDAEVIKAATTRLDAAETALDRMLAKEAELATSMPVVLRVPLAAELRRLEAFVRVNTAHHRVVFSVYLDDGMLASQLESFQSVLEQHAGILNDMMTEGVYLNRRGTNYFLEQCRRILEVGLDALIAESPDIGAFSTRYDHGTAVWPG